MKNQCFLHSKKPVEVYSEKLDLFNFGKTNLSFGLCSICGHIFQTTSVKKKEMENHYKKLSMYVDNLSKPSKDKIKSVQRHISIVKNEFKIFPKKVLEVSSMNSFNLIQFKKKGSNKIFALEPNVRVAKLLKKEGIKVFNKKIENFRSNLKFDLIILSHVLEHLFNPLLALRRCFSAQEVGQKILIEVPLFEKVDNYDIGSMGLEHIHYFSEKNLNELITSAGYEIDFVSKIFKSTEFPFITIVASKQKNVRIEKANNYKSNLENLNRYIKSSISHWKSIKNKIEKLPMDKPTYLFGAGPFTSQLLFYTMFKRKNLFGILDSSKIKQGGKLGALKILSPENKNLKKNSTIIISSASCQGHIYNSIKHFKKYGHKLVKLF
tara:strand:- start:1670 stop:2806 length:1137 start_codon:yes stop_codon:yes gene_type:complete